MKRNPLAATGVALILGGVLLAIAGGGLTAAAFKARSEAMVARQALDGSCKAALSKLGTLLATDAAMTLTVSPVADPRSALGDASSSLAFCPGWKIQNLCLGRTCRKPEEGVAMVVGFSRR